MYEGMDMELTLEEVGSLVGNQVASKVLRRVHQANDERSPQISALEQIRKLGRTALLLLLNLDGALNHGQFLDRILLGLATQALDGLERLRLATAAGEPPRGFGREEDEDQEGRGENPLQGEGHAPGPLVIALVVGVGGGRDDDAADGPGHLQRGGDGASEGQGDDLGCVGGRVGDEETPGDTLKQLSDDQDGQGIGL